MLQPRVERQRFSPGERRIERDIFRKISKLPSRRKFAGGRILVKHADGAAIGADQSQHQLDQRGLAGPVVADQRAQPPRDEVERDVAQRAHRAVVLHDAGYRDGRGHFPASLPVGLGGGAIKGWLSTTPPG